MSTAPAPGPTLRFSVNGEEIELADPGGRRLLDVLRYDLGLSGTKEGCGEGECGACSVLLDGELVDSCLVPIRQVEGRDVRTVEGLGVAAGAPGAPRGRGTATPEVLRAGAGTTVPAGLDALQAAFLVTGAAQCGICTPGMLMAARAFLDGGGEPTDAAIREAIAGNLCRCTGYTKIVEAIAVAASDGAGRVSPTTDGRSAGPDAVGPDGSRRTGGPRAVVAASAGPVVVAARTLDEALGLVADGWRPLAGGTDLMVLRAAGVVPANERYVDLTALGELRTIDRDGDELVVGALTTYTDLRRSREVAVRLPVLAEVAASIGAAQIQNRGTVGGNVINASPAGDTLPVLLATDARLVLRGPGGERTVDADRFFTGYRRTARAADELLVAIRFPLVAGRQLRYRKVGTRRAQAISKVVLAVAWRRADPEARAWTDVRVAYGSVAEVPLRARRAEAVLEGASPSTEVADRVASAAREDVRPIDDVRSTAEYRRLVSGRILRRIVLDEVGG